MLKSTFPLNFCLEFYIYKYISCIYLSLSQFWNKHVDFTCVCCPTWGVHTPPSLPWIPTPFNGNDFINNTNWIGGESDYYWIHLYLYMFISKLYTFPGSNIKRKWRLILFYIKSQYMHIKVHRSVKIENRENTLNTFISL